MILKHQKFFKLKQNQYLFPQNPSDPVTQQYYLIFLDYTIQLVSGYWVDLTLTVDTYFKYALGAPKYQKISYQQCKVSTTKMYTSFGPIFYEQKDLDTIPTVLMYFDDEHNILFLRKDHPNLQQALENFLKNNMVIAYSLRVELVDAIPIVSQVYLRTKVDPLQFIRKLIPHVTSICLTEEDQSLSVFGVPVINRDLFPGRLFPFVTENSRDYRTTMNYLFDRDSGGLGDDMITNDEDDWEDDDYEDEDDEDEDLEEETRADAEQYEYL